MRLVMVAVALALLTAPAYSQNSGIGGASGAGRAAAPPKDTPTEDPATKAKNEKAFKDAVNRIPVPEKKYDPWGTVRETGQSR